MFSHSLASRLALSCFSLIIFLSFLASTAIAQDCTIQGILQAGDSDTPLKNLRPFVNIDNSDGHLFNDPLTIPAGSRLQTIFNSLGYLRGNAVIYAPNNADLLARTTNSTVRSRYSAYSEVVELGQGSQTIGSPFGMVAEIEQPGVLGSSLEIDSIRAENSGISGPYLSNDPRENRVLINATVDGSPTAQKMCEFFGFRRALGANYRRSYTSPGDNRQIVYYPGSDSYSFIGASSGTSGYITNSQLDHIVCADPILPARCMAACANGVDDDGDGLTDFPADPGCTSAADTSEKQAGRNCDDGIDNDLDTFIDFPADPGCSSVNDGGETGGIACDNGNDDDGDGLKDFRPSLANTDPGCSGPGDNTETDPFGPACDNGVDDDADSLIDLAQDPGCSSVTDTTETDATCIASPTPVSYADNFTTHPGSNPAWIQTANNIGSVSAGVFDMISDNGQSNSIEFQNFALSNSTWSIDFDFRFESIDDCADGFFTELSHRIGGVEVNHNTIEIDTYKNTGEPHDGDNHSGGQIGRGAALAILDKDGNHLTFSNEDLHCTDFASGVYKHLRIEFLNGNYKVFLDGSLRLNLTIPSTYDNTVVTFNARSGVDSHRTKIRNLQINSVRAPLCTVCENGLDDDGDGLVDSADPGCSSPADPTETNPTGPACDNGVDDDGDGLIDLAQDPGCSSVTDTTETNPSGPACDNGVDDDGDSLVDSADPGCSGPTDPTETNPSGPACDNGVDDDGDSLVDSADPGCSGPTDPTETNPTGPACDNGVDDDGDSLVDSADPGCSGPTDTTETDGSACDNGLDDDGDTLVDSADPGCSGPTDTTETNPSGPACDNGVDDDLDGLRDVAQDPGCSSVTDTTETSGVACDNGLDDDGDGLRDFRPGLATRDPGCSSVTDTTETNPSGPQCDNGIDDDSDTLIDVAQDPDCDGPTDNTEAAPQPDLLPTPENVQASDGTSGSSITITWSPVVGATSYQIFRSEVESDNGTQIGTSSTTSFTDTTASPGIVYFYRIRAVNSSTQSLFSDADSGFVQEASRLSSPLFTKFNTFLAQQNILELSAVGSRGFVQSGATDNRIRLTMYNLRGQEMLTVSVSVPAGSQRDLDINLLLQSACSSNTSLCRNFEDLDGNGFVDTYGLIRLDFPDDDVNLALLGRTSNYRSNGDGTFSFAFAKDLRNSVRGTTYTVANTYDPQGLGFLVPNWAEVINLDSTRSRRFTYKLYTQNGTKVLERSFSVPPLGELDIQAGHEIITAGGRVSEGVYLVEVVPENSTFDYFMSVTRYSANAPRAVEPSSYNYAFALDGRPGAATNLYAAITNENRDADCALVQNWLEVANVRDVPTQVTVTFRETSIADAGLAAAQPGAVTVRSKGTQTITINPKSQFHFNASALLEKGTIGVAEISSSQPGAVISQSLVYFNNCDRNGVQTAYVTSSRQRSSQSSLTGTINTFLGMSNEVRLSATTATPTSLVFNSRLFGDGSASGLINLLGFQETNLIAENTFPVGTPNIDTGTIGTITLSSGFRTGAFVGDVLRVKRANIAGRSRIDFVLPSSIR